jgi:hypothetical protein
VPLILAGLVWLAVALSACLPVQPGAASLPVTASPSPQQPSATPSPTVTPTTTVTPSPLPPSATPTPSATPEPLGCLRPPDDYTLVRQNGYLLNQRTLTMLQQAASVYAGEIDILGYALTQGSYTDALSASFGTHAGGGVIDLSVMREGTYTILWDEIEPLISALRAAGFAAWQRDLDELGPGSPIHIHAVAIGDETLSPAAVGQLTGPFGYFRGYNGLPQPDGQPPIPDGHGGPVICTWMLTAGYSDLRVTPTPTP